MGVCALIGDTLTVAFLASATKEGGYGSSAGNPERITLPVGVTVGDIAILADMGTSGSGATTSSPSGSTIVANTTVGVARFITSYKQLDPSDITNGYLAGMGYQGVVTRLQKALLIFRPDGDVSALAASTPSAQGTSGSLTDQTVAASAAAGPIIVIAAGWSFTITFGISSTPSMDATILNGPSPNTESGIAYKLYPDAGVDHTVNLTGTGSENILQSFYLTVS